MLENFKALVCNTNLKINFFTLTSSHKILVLIDISKEQGEKFRQDVKDTEKKTRDAGK